MVRICLCSYLMTSRTLYRRANMERQWGFVCAAIWWDIPPAGGPRRRDGEVVLCSYLGEITYFLWVGQGRKMVRTCAAIRLDHILSAGGPRRRNCEDVFVQLSDKITYYLWVGKSEETVRMCLCSYPTRLHTSCGWVKVKHWRCVCVAIQ